MLYSIAVVFFVLWLLGLVTTTSFGAYLHILLLLAIAIIVLRLIRG